MGEYTPPFDFDGDHMADVKIVCDASFDDSLRLTGYAGGVYVSEGNRGTGTFLYQGLVGELHDIQEGELTAIFVGLRELYKRVSQSGQDQLEVNSLEIYTDSKSSVLGILQSNAIAQFNLSRRAQYIINQIRQLCQEQKWSPAVHHVNAHVSQLSATGIERLNQVADESASSIRKEGMRRMFEPRLGKSDHVAILLPSRARNSEEKELFRSLAIHLVESKKHPRIFVDNNAQSHPFISSMESYCRVKKIPLGRVFKVYDYNAQASHVGLDMTLYRHHATQQGKDPHFELKHSPPEVRSAIASKLMYGEAAPDLNHMERPTGRLYSPSFAIYDLMNPLPQDAPHFPNSVQGWVHTYTQYNKIPCISGIDNVLAHAGLHFDHNLGPRKESPIEIRHEDLQQLPTEDQLNADLAQLCKELYHELEPTQFAHVLVDDLVKHGYPNTDLFRNAMVRFIRITPQKEVDSYVHKVCRQANKLTPPSWTAEPKQQDLSLKPDVQVYSSPIRKRT